MALLLASIRQHGRRWMARGLASNVHSSSSSSSSRIIGSKLCVPCSEVVEWTTVSQQQQQMMGLAALSAAAAAAAAASSNWEKENVYCDNYKAVDGNNPLWPSGVAAETVDEYVGAILSDSSRNVAGIPDSVERIIYATTCRLTINAVYRFLSTLHGIELLGHHLELERLGLPSKSSSSPPLQLDISHTSGRINHDALEALAEELLSSKFINQRWIPDFIERQIYENCLKLIFALLDHVADTLSIQLCGHSLKISFEALTAHEVHAALHRDRQSSSSSTIDEATLNALVDDALEAAYRAEPGIARTILSKLPLYNTFVRELHKTLYGLILGIVDDLLQRTELVMLSESVKIHLVPGPIPDNLLDSKDSAPPPPKTTTPTTSEQSEETMIQTYKKEMEMAQRREVIAWYVTALSSAVAALAIFSISFKGR